ncbi:hypothetical protein J6590_000633, partial [Homalodisca vitripennis]
NHGNGVGMRRKSIAGCHDDDDVTTIRSVSSAGAILNTRTWTQGVRLLSDIRLLLFSVDCETSHATAVAEGCSTIWRDANTIDRQTGVHLQSPTPYLGTTNKSSPGRFIHFNRLYYRSQPSTICLDAVGMLIRTNSQPSIIWWTRNWLIPIVKVALIVYQVSRSPCGQSCVMRVLTSCVIH